MLLGVMHVIVDLLVFYTLKLFLVHETKKTFNCVCSVGGTVKKAYNVH